MMVPKKIMHPGMVDRYSTVKNSLRSVMVMHLNPSFS
jgi:hypothetical protein